MNQTPNIGLNKIDTSTDGDQFFDIDQDLNANWDAIDKWMVMQPFLLKSAVYDSTNTQITITIGKGRASFLKTLVILSTDTVYNILTPAINASYYLYLKNDGTFTYNTTGAAVSGAVPIWKVTTGSTVSAITVSDLRGVLPGSANQELADEIGVLSGLNTTAKDNLVNAIKEVKTEADGKVSKSGDSMTGALTVPSINFSDNGAVARPYASATAKGISLDSPQGFSFLAGLFNGHIGANAYYDATLGWQKFDKTKAGQYLTVNQNGYAQLTSSPSTSQDFTGASLNTLAQILSGGFKLESVSQQSSTTTASTGVQKIGTFTFPAPFSSGNIPVVIPSVNQGLSVVTSLAAYNITNSTFDLYGNVVVPSNSFTFSYVAIGS